MKIKAILCLMITLVMLITVVGCGESESSDNTPTPETTNTNKTENNIKVENDLGIPEEYLKPMTDLLGSWGIRKGSMSDPLIGTKILMYEKTKDEVGFMLVDLDGNGIKELITAPFDGYKENGLVYDILTIKDGKAFHLANSLQATYHFCDDNTFILRTPNEDKSFSFKNVVIIGDQRPIETEITKEEAAKFVLSTIELTAFSELEK